MADLDTSSKRRSSVALWASWLPAPPSPTDTPGVLDAADREHAAWAYSGILAEEPGDLAVRHLEWRGAYNLWHRSWSG